MEIFLTALVIQTYMLWMTDWKHKSTGEVVFTHHSLKSMQECAVIDSAELNQSV